MKTIKSFLDRPPEEIARYLFEFDSDLVVISTIDGYITCSIPELQSLADEISNLSSYDNHEAIFLQADNVSGALFIVAVHNTRRGPALGGCREDFYPTLGDALTDCLKLSQGMSRKNAISDIYYGGGKGAITKIKNRVFSDPLLRPALYQSWGRFVSLLGGLYITAEDMGNTTQDTTVMHHQTRFAACLPTSIGGSGNPSPVTAYGVLLGMKACVKHLYNDSSLKGLKIVVQGVGNVGRHLVNLLVENNAQVFVADINSNALNDITLKHKNVKIIPADHVLEEDCHIFAPCAHGGVINSNNIQNLKCEIICGAANNVLEDELKDGQALKDQSIIYPVDFNVNRGGVINAAMELFGYNKKMYSRK